ncbi:MAG: hypothetical protein AB1324_05405 [Candidatus Micrarchaeota archaeon]
MDRELERQLFHMGIGLWTILFLFIFGRTAAIAAVFLVICAGTLAINARLRGARLPLISWFEERFERRDAPIPGWGSACYAAGTLIPLTFLSDAGGIAAVIFILGVGDGLATIIGTRGRMRIPYSGRKTAEGSAAMFLSSLLAYAFAGEAALPLAIAATVAESLPLIDDNLSVPIACTAVLLVI